jgi:regulator of sigma E protease
MDFLSVATSAWLGGIDILWAIFAFLVVLTPLVFIHEMGHFLVARHFKVRVETFSIGFGREIWGWTDKLGTRWKISLLPLGGYVKFWGDEGASSTPDREMLKQLAEKAKTDPALKDCFHFKPLYQRSLIVAAGPAANFIFALLVFVVMLSTLGDVRLPARVGQLTAGGAAEEAGIQPGDIITNIEGDTIRYFDQIPAHVVLNAGTELAVEACRGGKTTVSDDGSILCEGGEVIKLKATPKSAEVKDRFGNVSRVGQLGVSSATAAELSPVAPPEARPEELSLYFKPDSTAGKAGFKAGDTIKEVNGIEVLYFHEISRAIQQSSSSEVAFTIDREGEPVVVPVDASIIRGPNESATTKRVSEYGLVGSGRSLDAEPLTYNPIQAVGVAVERIVGFVRITLTYIGQLIVGKGDPSQLSGPIGIAKVAGDYASVSLLTLINFAAVLSLSLGLINLFPIPMLDGGHLLYYAFEAVRGRPLGERAQEIGFRIGLALVLFLMVFATWNDLAK